VKGCKAKYPSFADLNTHIADRHLNIPTLAITDDSKALYISVSKTNFLQTTINTPARLSHAMVNMDLMAKVLASFYITKCDTLTMTRFIKLN
jgi:hypothetical protein